MGFNYNVFLDVISINMIHETMMTYVYDLFRKKTKQMIRSCSHALLDALPRIALTSSKTHERIATKMKITGQRCFDVRCSKLSQTISNCRHFIDEEF